MQFTKKYNLPVHTEEIENLKKCLTTKDVQSIDKNLSLHNSKKLNKNMIGPYDISGIFYQIFKGERISALYKLPRAEKKKWGQHILI